MEQELKEQAKELSRYGDLTVYTCLRHNAALLVLTNKNGEIYQNWHNMVSLDPPYKRMFDTLVAHLKATGVVAGESSVTAEQPLNVTEIVHCKGVGPDACGHCCLCNQTNYGPRLIK